MNTVKTARLLGAALLLPAASMTGCSFGTSIDNIMAPPKLSVEQEQIYSALTDAAGSSISLKYPRSGKYLSAFIVEDIDGDGGNEAVVFYERSGLGVEENTLRINVLDKDGDAWRSVCDTPAEGSEIEKVMISRLGTNDRVNLIIGSSLINRSEKNVTMYNYENGSITANFSESYSFFDVTDLDGDEENEFFLLAGAATGSPAKAEVFKLDGKGIYTKYSCDLSGSFSEFDSLSYGTLEDGRQALYIDAVSGAGSVQTDMIYLDGERLKKIFETPEESASTVRPAGCSCMDVDGDGVLEIPVQTIAEGYEEVPESEQIRLTNWMKVGQDNRLERKYSSYYSVGDGYIFIFPEKWRGKVTVKRDAVNDEMVFCTYEDGKAGSELMRIFAAEDVASREDRISTGYMLLHTKGETAYLAYVPPLTESSSELALSPADAAVRFCFRE